MAACGTAEQKEADEALAEKAKQYQYKAPPRKSVNEFAKEKDKSLKKYQEAILGDTSRIFDENVKGCFIFDEYILRPTGDWAKDYKDIVITADAAAKSTKKNPLFEIKEGMEYQRVMKFKVQRDMVFGLQYKAKTGSGMFKQTDTAKLGGYGPGKKTHVDR